MVPGRILPYLQLSDYAWCSPTCTEIKPVTVLEFGTCPSSTPPQGISYLSPHNKNLFGHGVCGGINPTEFFYSIVNGIGRVSPPSPVHHEEDRSGSGRHTLGSAARTRHEPLTIAVELIRTAAGMSVNHLIESRTGTTTSVGCSNDFPVAVLLDKVGNDRHDTLRVLDPEL